MGAHRQGPHLGATSCRRSRHLTTAGRGWSFVGPPSKGKRTWPSPDGGQGKPSLTYERAWGWSDRLPALSRGSTRPILTTLALQLLA